MSCSSLARVAQLQVSPPEALGAFVDDRVSVRTDLAPRGDLLDRRGRLIAATRTGERLFVDPVRFPQPYDRSIMRLADACFSIPVVLMAIATATVFGNSMKTTVGVLSFVLWAQYARIARAEALSLRSSYYVLYARLVGVSSIRTIARHIIPNVQNSIVVLATLHVGWVIIVESALGFLGAGTILRAKDGTEVQGLTTASTVWIAAALGVTAGLGAWFITIAGTVVTLVVLTFGKRLEDRLIRVFGRNSNADD